MTGAQVNVAITGIGMVTPCGPDRESSWQGLISGASRIRWLSSAEHERLECDPARTRLAGAPAILPNSIGGNVLTPDATAVRSRERCTTELMALAMTREALADAGLRLDAVDRRRCGLVLGTSKGHLAILHQQYRAAHHIDHRPDGPAAEPQPPEFPMGWCTAPAWGVQREWGFGGPVLAPVAACATGMLSICRGAELIRQGMCDVVVAGSVDDSFSELLWASYRRLGVLARIRDQEPQVACRPFDLHRSGFLMGAGGAVVVLERLESCLARGRHPYGEWLAGGSVSDGSALTQVSDDAASLTYLLRDLLRRGQVTPEEIDYISLHGTGTRDNDRHEALGIRSALGTAADRVACSSLKGTIGHLLGGAGSVEFATLLLAMRDSVIPPTANWETADPECPLHCTPRTAINRPINVGLKLSLGFGGHLVGAIVRSHGVK